MRILLIILMLSPLASQAEEHTLPMVSRPQHFFLNGATFIPNQCMLTITHEKNGEGSIRFTSVDTVRDLKSSAAIQTLTADEMANGYALKAKSENGFLYLVEVKGTSGFRKVMESSLRVFNEKSGGTIHTDELCKREQIPTM